MNFFKRLFMSPFDQLVEIFGGNEKIRFWNGTNYGPEVMFKQGPDHNGHGRVYYSFDCPPPFIKLSMGLCNPYWSDWSGKTYENCVEIYVHQNTEIVWCSVQVNGDWRKQRLLQKRVNRLLSKLRVGTVLETENELLRKTMATFFEARPESRCRHCIHLNGITERNLESMKEDLKKNEDEYVEWHAKVEVVSKTNGAVLGTFTGLDAAHGFVKYDIQAPLSNKLEDYEFKIIS